MKKKELKNIAKRIADAEYIVDNSNDEMKIREAKEVIMTQSMRLNNTEDMLAVDDMVQEILKNYENS